MNALVIGREVAMQEPSFEKLAADAAAGLRADQEVYRDVTQELHSFLEDKADRFRREGHDEAESVGLAKKAFGSPLEVASELLNANRGRLRLRALLRIGFNALIIPLAILMALYVGYGRAARVQNASAMLIGGGAKLPTLPFLGTKAVLDAKHAGLLRLPVGTTGNAPRLRQFWEAHRDDLDGYKYYAYYALYASGDEAQYARDMREGERIEPDNALYNVLLAEYYLNRGVQARSDSKKKPFDDILDRRLFNFGIVELHKAVKKPYLRTYHLDIVRLRLNALPRPLLTEDYLNRISMTSAELFPYYARYRNLARKISAGARSLNEEGQTHDAEAVMDAGESYAILLARDEDTVLIGALVSTAVASIVTKDGAEFYGQIGAQTKARQAQALYSKLRNFSGNWKASRHNNPAFTKMLKRHGSNLSSVIFPVFGGVVPITEGELTPGRMQEHALIEGFGLEFLQLLLALLLVGTVMQGIIWHYRLRGAVSAPLLLMPPAREILRILWWGVALPILIYAVYSRLPIIGGRQYGWGYLGWRFGAELLVLGFLVLWLPARMINRYVRRRCDDLEIPLPPAHEEAAVSRMVRGMLIGAIVLAVIVMALPSDRTPLVLKFIGILLALALIVTGARYAAAKRREFGLYYGTLARSMAPLYAFAIILLTLTAQPWLLYREATWLHRDTVLLGYLANSNSGPTACTSIETRVTQDYSRKLLQVLDRKR